jgi:hypothetical protein
LLRCSATNRKFAGLIPDGVIGMFHGHNPSDRTMALGVDSASNSNEYQEDVLAGRCVRLTTLPPSCALVMKSGNLNFLEPSGPLQACNGTALPLPFTSVVSCRHHFTNALCSSSSACCYYQKKERAKPEKRVLSTCSVSEGSVKRSD